LKEIYCTETSPSVRPPQCCHLVIKNAAHLPTLFHYPLYVIKECLS
jgi:hypothetical protein